MGVDYDLVIVGGSAAGRYAALTASQQLARVALVEPEFNQGLYNYAMRESIHHPSPDWVEEVVAKIAEQSNPAVLAAQGVDFIVGSGQFQASPHLAFTVEDRQLRAPKYLIASGSHPIIPDIPGLQNGYLTLANWHQQPLLPTNWVIIGGVPQSVEIAQILARLGKKVTLIVAESQILPGFEPEITQLLQAQLEADGVRVFTQTTVTQVQQIQSKKRVQAGDMSIACEAILVATGVQPNFETLNLAAVGVRYSNRLQVNKKLQTTNRRIYACGDVIGGYDFPNLADYEARIAVNNALFSPSQVNYQSIPLCVFTEPPLAQVGWTEAQAKRCYPPEDVVVLQQYFKTLAAAQLGSAMTGICKLVVLGNGEILGGSVLGAVAGELINLIALAIAQKISVKAIANLSPTHPSFSEILSQTAQQWQQQASTTTFYDSRASYFHRRRRM